MQKTFQNALKWHMEREQTRVVDLVRATGVSRDTINKILRRDNASTSAENALLIAAYFGKSLETFILCDEVASVQHLAALAELMRPEEARLIEAQVMGILKSRGSLKTD